LKRKLPNVRNYGCGRTRDGNTNVNYKRKSVL
jgi:hypothetical protein